MREIYFKATDNRKGEFGVVSANLYRTRGIILNIAVVFVLCYVSYMLGILLSFNKADCEAISLL